MGNLPVCQTSIKELRFPLYTRAKFVSKYVQNLYRNMRKKWIYSIEIHHLFITPLGNYSCVFNVEVTVKQNNVFCMHDEKSQAASTILFDYCESF